MQWIQRYSFYQKIQAVLILFLLVPLLIISALSFYTNRNVVLENIQTNNEAMMKALVNDLSKTANDVLYTMNQISPYQASELFIGLRQLKDMTSFKSHAQYLEYMKLNQNASLVLGRLVNIDAVIFFINASDYPIVGPIDSRQVAELKENPDFQHMAFSEAEQHALHWFQAKSYSTSYSRKQSTYYFAKKTIVDPARKQLLGTVFIGIPQSYFQQLLHAGTGRFRLYNGEEHLIYGSAESREELHHGWLRTEKSIPGTGWRLQYEVPKNEVTGQVAQRFYFLLLIIVLVLFTFLFMSIVLARGLNKPILKLMRITKEYGKGNLAVRYHSQGKDEISVLGQEINNMMDQVNALLHKVDTEQEEKRVIELQALFSQLQPHFLLNTLNSIKCRLALSGDHVHSETIDALMSVLRAHLRVHEPVSLQEECRLNSKYVSIMNMRSSQNIQLEVSLPDALANKMVPRLILQPLVENAIVHGFSRPLDHAVIKISAQETQSGIMIQVVDNGKGVSKEQIHRWRSQGIEESRNGRGIGLFNVERRLQLTYGKDASLKIEPNRPRGLICQLYIPNDKV